MRLEIVEEDVEGASASGGEELDAGRMEDLGEEVAAEVAPEWAIRGGADPELVAGEEVVGEDGRAVGEDSALLD